MEIVAIFCKNSGLLQEKNRFFQVFFLFACLSLRVRYILVLNKEKLYV